jgi:hypothetical protein
MAKSRHASDEYTRTRLLNRLGLFQCPSGSVRLRYKPSSSSSPSGLVSSDLSTTKYPNLGRGTTHHHNHHRRKPSILGEINPTQVKLKEGSVGVYDDDSSSSFSSTTQPSSFFTSASPTSSTADIAADCATSKNAHHIAAVLPPPSTCSLTPKCAKPRVRFNENVDVVSIPSRYQYSDRIRKVLWSNKHEIMENAERNIIEYEAEGWDWNTVVLEEEMFVDSLTGSLVHPCHLLLDGDVEGGSEELSPSPESQELKQQQPQQELYVPCSSAQGMEPLEHDSDGGDDEDADDDSFFRPLERQASVVTFSS